MAQGWPYGARFREQGHCQGHGVSSVLRSMPSDADRPGRVRRSSSHYTQDVRSSRTSCPGMDLQEPGAPFYAGPRSTIQVCPPARPCTPPARAALTWGGPLQALWAHAPVRSRDPLRLPSHLEPVTLLQVECGHSARRGSRALPTRHALRRPAARQASPGLAMLWQGPPSPSFTHTPRTSSSTRPQVHRR